MIIGRNGTVFVVTGTTFRKSKADAANYYVFQVEKATFWIDQDLNCLYLISINQRQRV
jgi:hypothetical protein